MGKKSKRRRAKKAASGDTSKQVSIALDDINNRVENFFESLSNVQNQYIVCIAKRVHYSDVISYIKKMKQRHDSVLEKRKLFLKTRSGPELFRRYLLRYFDTLIQFEYYCWDFNAVIETYCDLQKNQNIDIMNSDTKEAIRIQLYHKLALLGNGTDNASPAPLSTSFLKELQNFPDLVEGYHLHKQVINVLRVTKNFDTAISIDLDEKNPLLPTVSEPAIVKVSLLVSYIERYKAEFHHCSKKDDYFLIKELISEIEENYLRDVEKFDTQRLRDFLLARAQWFYLISPLHDDDIYKKGCYNLAVGDLEFVLGKMWMSKDKCTLCHCAPSEVDFESVCEECHVACYCSIDHQRLSWKKNAIDGMRIGHQALCPLMNTYRRLKLEKTSPRCFRKECLRFLACDLKLKGKCFTKHDGLQCNDELSSTTYVSDILPHLYAAETRSRPTLYLGEYADNPRKDINEKMRALVIDWLVEWRVAPETLYLCVNIVDRYCSIQDVRRSQLQLVGTAAIRLACKYEELCQPEISECVWSTDNVYTSEELLDMEQDIVAKLECCFTVPTAYPFLRIFLKLVGASDLVKHAASYYNERTLQEHEFLQYRPSEVCAASMVLALNHPKIAEEDGRELNTVKAYISQILFEYTGFDTRKAYIPPILLESTGFDKERIYQIAKVIAGKVAEEPIIGDRHLIAVKNKYNDEKYSYISTQYDLPSMPRNL